MTAALRLLLAGWLWANGFAAAQPMYGTVSGLILDAASRESLPHSNVFLAHTTLGVVSDLSGAFTIRQIPPGRYQLVANRVGYRPAIADLQVAAGDTLQRTLLLQLKPIEAGEMQVVATVPKNWRHQLSRFKRAFIGETVNSRDCVIDNPEFLRFDSDPARPELIAASDSTLRITNRALGYRLYVVIDTFRWSDQMGFYAIYPRFEELTPQDDAERARWHERRRRVWLGSFRHFLSAMVRGSCEKEGFQLFLKEQAGQHVSPAERINSAQLIESLSNIGLKLSFSGFLEVQHQSGQPPSTIRLNQNFVFLEENGDLFPPLSVILYGHWAQQRIADTLPLDYLPPQ